MVSTVEPRHASNCRSSSELTVTIWVFIRGSLGELLLQVLIAWEFLLGALIHCPELPE